MRLPVLTGRTAHITFEDLTIIGRRGKTNHAGCFCDAFALEKKRQAVLDTQEQNIVKDRHFHIFLKETAALTFTDIDVSRHIIQGYFLPAVLLKIGQDFPQALQMLLRVMFGLREGSIIPVEALPDTC